MGRPTIIVPEPLTQVPYHEVLIGYLELEFRLLIGQGLHTPSKQFLRGNYDQHYDTEGTVRGQQFSYP